MWTADVHDPQSQAAMLHHSCDCDQQAAMLLHQPLVPSRGCSRVMSRLKQMPLTRRTGAAATWIPCRRVHLGWALQADAPLKVDVSLPRGGQERLRWCWPLCAKRAPLQCFVCYCMTTLMGWEANE